MNRLSATRRAFLAAAGALAAAPTLGGVAQAQPVMERPLNRFDRALVLSGGGARGVYEAGIIDYLRLSRQIPDGQPLAPYEFVTGTSIGALNGYFVATAQYSKLRELWYTVADQRIVIPKKQYENIRNENSGVLTRAYETALLLKELSTDDTGVVSGSHLRAWMAQHIDPKTPVVMPFVWAVTNLTRQSPEFFYLVASDLTPEQHANAEQAVRFTVGPQVELREATPDLLIDALRASAAIPLAFDPVMLPAAEGNTLNAYVDGGVTANTPVSVARAAARRIDVVMLDPPLQTPTYRNAIDIGIGVFGAMQRRILESDLRSAFLESYAKSTIETARGQVRGIAQRRDINVSSIDVAGVNDLSQSLFETQIFEIHPDKELTVSVAGFNDREALFTTFKTGFNDIAVKGFTPYQLPQA